jgi:L-lactate dehydrogenase (cytochrome)
MPKSVEYSELAKHGSADDLWIAVNGEVYDMTEFAQEHPGGPDGKFNSILQHVKS